jgi:cytochrome c oxidase assembly protein subunit 15
MTAEKNHIVLFRKTSRVTLIAVYVLILVGGIVRSTGSGMGCPDWPKCFGMWIPPTDESQLAETYKEDFVEYRKNKNIKFATYLDVMGFEEKAEQVRSDQSILTETEFNVSKTWTEYINRLIGAVIGLLIIINFLASWKFLKEDKSVFIWSLMLVIMVIFQGWIGSVVVSTNLLPWMVTIHMLLAMLIVAVLIYLVFKVRNRPGRLVIIPDKRMLNSLMIISGILITFQILLGTQVREAIDEVAISLNFQNRDSWVGMAGISFIIHRSLSILLVLSQIGVFYILYRNGLLKTGLTNYTGIILGVIVLEVLLGVIMSYFGIPPFAQPLHLLFAVIIFGLQFLAILTLNGKNNEGIYKTQIAV